MDSPSLPTGQALVEESGDAFREIRFRGHPLDQGVRLPHRGPDVSVEVSVDLTRILQAVGVAAFPSMNSKELAADPHLNERGFFVCLLHPEVGVRVHTGIPWLLTNAPHGVQAPAPLLGNTPLRCCGIFWATLKKRSPGCERSRLCIEREGDLPPTLDRPECVERPRRRRTPACAGRV